VCSDHYTAAGRCQLLCKADVPVGRRDIGGNEPGLRRVHHRPACRRCGRNGRSVFRRPQGPPRHECQHCALGSASQIPTGRENFVRAAAVSFIHLSLISRTGAACAAANGSGGSSLRPRAGGEPAAAEREHRRHLWGQLVWVGVPPHARPGPSEWVGVPGGPRDRTC
jgi:hypothetical protein